MELNTIVGLTVIAILAVWAILDWKRLTDWFVENMEPHEPEDQHRYFRKIGEEIARCKTVQDITRVHAMIDQFEKWNRNESGRQFTYQLRLLANRRSNRLSVQRA